MGLRSQDEGDTKKLPQSWRWRDNIPLARIAFCSARYATDVKFHITHKIQIINRMEIRPMEISQSESSVQTIWGVARFIIATWIV